MRSAPRRINTKYPAHWSKPTLVAANFPQEDVAEGVPEVLHVCTERSFDVALQIGLLHLDDFLEAARRFVEDRWDQARLDLDVKIIELLRIEAEEVWARGAHPHQLDVPAELIEKPRELVDPVSPEQFSVLGDPEVVLEFSGRGKAV